MKRLISSLIRSTFLSIVLLVISFASMGATLETTPLKINQNKVQVSVSSAIHMTNFFHEEQHLDKYCDFKNCHVCSHCGLVQTEFSMLTFESNQVFFTYDSFLINIFLDVPLHPPQYF